MVEGLDLSGLEADVNLIDRTIAGSYHQNTRLRNREISLLVHLFKETRDEVVAGNRRQDAYRVFDPLSSPVRFDFEAFDGNQYYLTAYSLNAPQMRPDKENDNAAYQVMLLQLVANDPYIYRDIETRIEIAGFEGGFEFDWEIPPEGYEFERRSESLFGIVEYPGTNPGGMTVNYRARGPVSNPTLINVSTLEQMKLNFDMQQGDIISINTERGNRSITLIRNNVRTNVFYSYSLLESVFLELNPGTNVFRYQADSGEENLEVVIRYRDRRVGI